MAGTTMYPFLNSSKLIIPLSMSAILPNIMPLVWHIRSGNITTSSIIFWLLTLNAINFINGIIWHNDDLSNWFRGLYLCDIELRLIVGASYGGLPGAALCLSRSLARMLQTEKQRSVLVKKQWVEDTLLCWALPAWMMVVYYAVQTSRYTISAGYGCSPPFSASWMSIVLVFMWPILLMLPTCYYTLIMIHRLRVYRTQVSSFLASSKTSRARFTRLMIIATLLTIATLGSSVGQLVNFLRLGMRHYSWKEVHDEWNYARLKPSGEVNGDGHHADRWLWVAYGYCSFFTLGMGHEVRLQYVAGLKKIGLERWFEFGVEVTKSHRGLRTRTWFSSLGNGKKGFGNIGFKEKVLTAACSSSSSTESSRLSTFSRPSGGSPVLVITQLKNAVTRQLREISDKKWPVYSRMPSFGQAFAGVLPANLSHRMPEEAGSEILITLPSPTAGCLSDDSILQMVGAAPLIKQTKHIAEIV